MKLEVTEVLLLEEHGEVSLSELAELTRLTEAELLELVDCEVLIPSDPVAEPMRFEARYIMAARTARRLRRDFELDVHGVALALTLIERIRELEAQLRSLGARVPGVHD